MEIHEKIEWAEGGEGRGRRNENVQQTLEKIEGKDPNFPNLRRDTNIDSRNIMIQTQKIVQQNLEHSKY